MIAASELRIKNWVKYPVHEKCDKTVCIKSINEDGIDLYVSDNNAPEEGYYYIQPYYRFDEIQPIPLTPEILEKCGGSRGMFGYSLKIGALTMLFRFVDTHVYSELGGIYLGDRIEFLHQLQNLKHLFTGQELEVKL